MKNSEVRVLLDDRSEKIGRKIRDAELKKIPYMLIVGEKEEGEGLVSVRKRGTGDLGSMPVADFAKMVENQVADEQKVEY